MTGAGLMKLLTPRAKLVANPHTAWATDFTEQQVKLIGLAEVVGAVGLVVPWVTGILPVLTPVAAAALAVILSTPPRTLVVSDSPLHRHRLRWAPCAVPRVRLGRPPWRMARIGFALITLLRVAVLSGAAATHLRRKEPAVPPIILAALCVVVAVGRGLL